MVSNEPNNRNKKIIASLMIIVAVSIIALENSALNKKKDTADASSNTSVISTSTPEHSPSSTPTTIDTSTGQTADSSSGFTNGTYSAKGSYISPGGIESVSLTLTINDGVVSSSSVVTSGNNRGSVEYQTDFKNGYKTFVVGKKISDIKLSRVSGSSLTSQGFNNALAQIKSQAQS